MTKPPAADVPIRSAEELTRRWTALLDPPVFGARSLWLTWLRGDGLLLPVVVPVDDIPGVPDAALLGACCRCTTGSHRATWTARVTWRWRCAGPVGPRSPRTTTAGPRRSPRCSTTQIDGTWSLHLAAAGRGRAPGGPAGMSSRVAPCSSSDARKRIRSDRTGATHHRRVVSRAGCRSALATLPPSDARHVAQTFIEAGYDEDWRRHGTCVRVDPHADRRLHRASPRRRRVLTRTRRPS